MFIETNSVTAGLQPSAQKKAVRGAARISEMKTVEKACYVLNAVISSCGYVSLHVTHRRQSRIDPFHARQSTPFNGTTAFETDKGLLILSVCGAHYYALAADKFAEWIEEYFRQLQDCPTMALIQLPNEIAFSRVG